MTSTSPSQSAPANRGVAFQDALQAAAEIAAYSPSSHNCQPWGVGWAIGAAARHTAVALLADTAEQTGAGCGPAARNEVEYLVLALDRARQLTALSSHGVEMLVSCGAYGEILLRALAAQGWRADRVRFVDPAPAAHGLKDDDPDRIFGGRWPRAWMPLCVVRLSHAPTPSGDLAELRDTVRARHTNRGPYRPDRIEPAVLAGLSTTRSGLSLFRAAPGGDSEVTVRHVVADAERAAVGDLVSRHGGRDFSHRAAWRETHSFIRRDEADAETSGDGFTLGQLFGPMSPPRRFGMRIALAPVTMRILRHVGYHRILARQLAAMVRCSPAAVALCFDDGAPGAESVVRGGAVLADYWLGATRAGLVLHPVSVILQHDDVRAELEQRLGLPGRAFFVSRLGHAVTAFPPSRRLAASHALRLV
ncbi:RedV protein [Streptomyces ferrugineus]|uniref:RedV protein n=1 Tax=Streptomyces ferrugineus TaxID=1413221 RepID=A0A7M2SH47_9ACTN|nr:RedV protein [Streptomyces ferrugineus]QOV34521.1 RedV protein [Streptomyces ferrugineus]